MPSSTVDRFSEKASVRDFWNRGSCREIYAQRDGLLKQMRAQAAEPYRLEPYISPFARFSEGEGKDVLEICVGMGADFEEWARSKPRSLHGLDLTERAAAHCPAC